MDDHSCTENRFSVVLSTSNKVLCCNLPFQISGKAVCNVNLMYALLQAEVTGGGVPLAEINCSTMESKKLSGLYLCGEVCDVFGRIGGFNFYWAWLSGRLAGLSAAAHCQSDDQALQDLQHHVWGCAIFYCVAKFASAAWQRQTN